MEQNYETYELILRDEEDGTFALSLVSEPAIMQDFVWLNKDGKVEIKFASVDEDKHLIVGPWNSLLCAVLTRNGKKDCTKIYQR